MEEPRYFIQLAFDGSRYCGWQRQDNAPTVQGEIENALSLLLKKPTAIIGCGRTDTGVHAKDFFAHFSHPVLTPEQAEDIAHRLNRMLPEDIAISEIFRVGAGAHARFSAVSRTYRYYVSTRKNPFTKAYRWSRPLLPDIVKMNNAAELLRGTQDFSSFAKLHAQTLTNICTVNQAYWEEIGSDLIFTITADRFLRNMVRAIVGTLWKLGIGQTDLAGFIETMQKKDRSAAGMSVPACGLFLEKVVYPDEIRLISI